MVIIYVSILGSRANLAPSGADSLHRVLPFHGPGADIQIMDVLFDNEIAGKPGKVIPVPHLVFEVTPTGLPGPYPDGATKIVGLQSHNVPNGPVMDPLDCFTKS